MSFPFYIAYRYLISKKSRNIINIISLISVIGVCIGSMALIVVLSVFNGFEGLVVSLINSFSSDLIITAKQGKTFDSTSFPIDSVKNIKGVLHYTEILEENALLKYKNNQYIATIKGVSDDYLKASGIDTTLVQGEFILKEENIHYAVIGLGLQNALSINIQDEFSSISVSVPKRGVSASADVLNPENSFNRKNIYPKGVFSIQQNIDEKYMLVPIDFARKLLNYKTEISAIELNIDGNANTDDVQEQIKVMLGESFVVKNRYQQNELIYQIMKTEKWAVFFILTFILIIASFNIIGSLTMLIIEKRKDISILISLGATYMEIKKIFLFTGILISTGGIMMGFLLGIMLCYLQQEFGLLSIGNSGSFIIDSYPVKMKLIDFILVFCTVLGIGIIASWHPSSQSVNDVAMPSS